MHEMGIANSVLDAVRAETRRFTSRHVYKVGVRIGELAGVDPEAMAFCFDALVLGTELEPLALEIEYCLCRSQCRACGHSYAASPGTVECPQCGVADPKFLSGDELEIAYLEVEDGACAAGA
jgi:hydrogenase nickel incorporation protein HypA/HybF